MRVRECERERGTFGGCVYAVWKLLFFSLSLSLFRESIRGCCRMNGKGKKREGKTFLCLRWQMASTAFSRIRVERSHSQEFLLNSLSRALVGV